MFNKDLQQEMKRRSQAAEDTIWNHYNESNVEVYKDYLESLSVEELEQLAEKVVKETA